jgi:hypothetical protein
LEESLWVAWPLGWDNDLEFLLACGSDGNETIFEFVTQGSPFILKRLSPILRRYLEGRRGSEDGSLLRREALLLRKHKRDVE